MLEVKRKYLNDNQKRFQLPSIPIIFETEPSDIILRSDINNVLNTIDKDIVKQFKRVPCKKHKWTQTDFRDSECQTIPWEASYVIKTASEETSAILHLQNLTWEHGLPAGSHEVDVINTIQKRRELSEAMPAINTKYNLHLATKIIDNLEALNLDSREKEIQYILDIRMKLYKNLTKKKNDDAETKFENRLHKLHEHLNYRRKNAVNKIRYTYNKELRKLSGKYKSRSNHGEITRDFVNTADHITPDLTCLKQSGKTDLKLVDKTFYESLKKYTVQDHGLIGPKPKPDSLCIRFTKWNDEKLRSLYDELKNIRFNVKVSDEINQLKQNVKTEKLSASSTPRAEKMQTLLEAKNIKNKMLEEQDKYLIKKEELESNNVSYAENSLLTQEKVSRTINLQSHENEELREEERINEILDSLEGMAVSEMLDFLSKVN